MTVAAEPTIHSRVALVRAAIWLYQIHLAGSIFENVTAKLFYPPQAYLELFIKISQV